MLGLGLSSALAVQEASLEQGCGTEQRLFPASLEGDSSAVLQRPHSETWRQAEVSRGLGGSGLGSFAAAHTDYLLQAWAGGGPEELASLAEWENTDTGALTIKPAGCYQGWLERLLTYTLEHHVPQPKDAVCCTAGRHAPTHEHLRCFGSEQLFDSSLGSDSSFC